MSDDSTSSSPGARFGSAPPSERLEPSPPTAPVASPPPLEAEVESSSAPPLPSRVEQEKKKKRPRKDSIAQPSSPVTLAYSPASQSSGAAASSLDFLALAETRPTHTP